MKSADYWRRRFELLEESQNKRANTVKSEVERHFTAAQRTLDEQIHAWYGRFADNNQTSLADAKKRLTDKELAELKWDVNEYIKYGKENALNRQWMTQLENASARVHISRLEALKLQTQNTTERLFATQRGVVDKLLNDTYTDGYYKAIYEIQRGEGVGSAFAGINEDALSKVLSQPWAADGETFSDRIWAQKDKLIDEIHTQLTQNMILGRPPDAAIKAVSAKLGVSRANAGRLIMTESAYVVNLAQKDAYGELGVEMIEILGTLDDKTCALCGSFDGKTLKLSESEAGVTAPPFHPWCRCTTIPYFADDDGERIARGADGKNYYVPGDMKYADWKAAFVDNGINKKYSSALPSGILNNMMLNSEKAVEIINNQQPMDEKVVNRVKTALLKKGDVLDQSPELDKMLINYGKEAVTYSEGTIIMHTKVSASGFFEELIHYGQIKSGRAKENDIKNYYQLEIEAKEKLIKHKKAYKINEYEVDILTDILNKYRIELKNYQ